MTAPISQPLITVAPALAGSWGWAQTIALIVPAIAAFGALVIWQLGQRAQRYERRSQTFAAALAVVEAYAEMPYRIRRRLDDPSVRRELTEAISNIQADIAWHQAWLELQAPGVTDPYRKLVRDTRAQAGAQMRDAWTQPVLHHDHEMNLQTAYPREQIDAARAECLDAMRQALSGFWR